MRYDTEQIKQVVSCAELLQINGIEVNHKGRALCPFHSDTHPSMAVYPNGVHCFACGAHADVIALACQLYDCNFITACKILSEQFGIATMNDSSEYIRKAEEMRRKRQQRANRLELLRNDYYNAIAAFRQAEADKERYAPRSPTETPDMHFFAALDAYNAAADRMRKAEWALHDAEVKK